MSRVPHDEWASSRWAFLREGRRLQISCSCVVGFGFGFLGLSGGSTSVPVRLCPSEAAPFQAPCFFDSGTPQPREGDPSSAAIERERDLDKVSCLAQKRSLTSSMGLWGRAIGMAGMQECWNAGMQECKECKAASHELWRPYISGTYLERSTEVPQTSGLSSVNGDICRLSRLIMSCHDVVVHVTTALDLCEIPLDQPRRGQEGVMHTSHARKQEKGQRVRNRGGWTRGGQRGPQEGDQSEGGLDRSAGRFLTSPV